MAHKPTEQPLDERLTTLLGVERRLAQQVREAQTAAARAVAQAQVDGERARQEALAQEAAQAQVEEADDLAGHAAALEALAAEHATLMAWLTQVPEALVEQLARRAVDRALGAEGGPP